MVNSAPSGSESSSRDFFTHQEVIDAWKDEPYLGKHGGTFYAPLFYVENGKLLDRLENDDRVAPLSESFLKSQVCDFLVDYERYKSLDRVKSDDRVAPLSKDFQNKVRDFRIDYEGYRSLSKWRALYVGCLVGFPWWGLCCF